MNTVPYPIFYSALICAILAFGITDCKTHRSEGKKIDARGLQNRKLAPCPTSPNCVSSQADPNDTRHYMKPIGYQGSREKARETLLTIIAELPRTQIVTQKDEYIHATVKSRGFGFIDDVEFYLPNDEPVIHFCSAARSGYYDFGVNRKRMKKVKELFNQRN